MKCRSIVYARRQLCVMIVWLRLERSRNLYLDPRARSKNTGKAAIDRKQAFFGFEVMGPCAGTQSLAPRSKTPTV